MKYYAVTDDPKELMHFGIKGMKWGVIRTDAQLGHLQAPKMPKGMKSKQKVRSNAYRKASSKLSEGMRHGIAKAKAKIADYNSPVNKSIRAANKKEKLFQKHLQQARKGTLKYKNVSDDEVYRITDRLAAERNSRGLSGAEGNGFMRRLGSSIGEGVIQGAGRGIANRTSEWISRGGELKTQRMKKELDNAFDREQRAWNARFDRDQENIRYRRDLRREAAKDSRDLKKAYTQMAQEEGLRVPNRVSQAEMRKYLYETNRNRDAKKIKDQRDYEREKLTEQRNYERDKMMEQRDYDRNKALEDRSYNMANTMIKSHADKLYSEAQKQYKKEKENYKTAHDAWKDGGKQGPEPPKPLAPQYDDMFAFAYDRYEQNRRNGSGRW